MNPQDPLAELREIVIPPPPSFWPLAPGWWLALALLLTVLLVLSWLTWRWWRRTAPRRMALRQLQALRTELHAAEDTLLIVRRLSQLLRETALRCHPWERVAGLHGQAWLEFLDSTGGAQQFTQGEGKILAEAPYRAEVQDVEPARLFPICQAWIRQQRLPSSRSAHA
jgi:hypothetical protein